MKNYKKIRINEHMDHEVSDRLCICKCSIALKNYVTSKRILNFEVQF